MTPYKKWFKLITWKIIFEIKKNLICQSNFYQLFKQSISNLKNNQKMNYIGRSNPFAYT